MTQALKSMTHGSSREAEHSASQSARTLSTNSRSRLRPRQSGEHSPWQVSPSLLRGWREVVSFDTSGAAIIGDFTMTRATDVRVTMDSQFFVQVLLDGHNILSSARMPRTLSTAKVLFGRLRADTDMRFPLPSGGRWRSLFVGISDRAVRHMWDMDPESLMDALRKSEPEAGENNASIFECSSYLPVEKHGVIERIVNCSLPRPQRMAFIWSRSLELMVDTVSNALSEAQRGTAPYPRSRASVLAAREIVHNEISHPHTIDSLSYRVGMSRRDFMNSFKEQLGVTFHDYYMETRMSRAADLLSEGRLRVSEVSDKIGYTQLSSFSRAFKAFYGVAPRTFGASQWDVRRACG